MKSCSWVKDKGCISAVSRQEQICTNFDRMNKFWFAHNLPCGYSSTCPHEPCFEDDFWPFRWPAASKLLQRTVVACCSLSPGSVACRWALAKTASMLDVLPQFDEVRDLVAKSQASLVAAVGGFARGLVFGIFFWLRTVYLNKYKVIE